jgi:phospholipid/cholesterol/gamma-HCH transport system substrate-binding protein
MYVAPGMLGGRTGRQVTRAAAVATVIVAVTFVSVVLVGAGAEDYSVVARFQSASQLVDGNEVLVAGRRVGTVTDIRLARDGQAEAVLQIDDPQFAPLRRGTEAIIRQASLAGVANRYVLLRLPPSTARPLPDGGVIPAGDTESAVDLDAIFNTFDARTRRSLQGVVAGSKRAFRGRARPASEALLYLNPALAASERLVSDLESDTVALERLLGASANLMTDLAAEREHLAPLVRDLGATTAAVRSRRPELGRALEQLPGVLRRSNSTFVNLRAALDDADPLVDAARPAARALTPLARELRRTARVSRPGLRDLAALVRGPRGRDADDLVDTLRLLPPLRDAGVRPTQANGAEREGALPATARALRGLVAPTAFLRPYSVDLTGWFDTFSHTGVYDALGGTGRIAFHGNAFTAVGSNLAYVPPALRDEVFDQLANRGEDNRCPGSIERGAAWKPTPDFNCDLSQVPPGP